MEKKQLRELVTSVLEGLKLNTPSAVDLVLGTIAQESAGGKYLKQLGSGPALGICQMEPATFEDIMNNYIKYRPKWLGRIKQVANITELKAESMIYNLAFSIAMCRVHYLRVSKPLPKSGDLRGYAEYWKEFYNTSLGKGTVEEFIDNYNKYVL